MKLELTNGESVRQINLHDVAGLVVLDMSPCSDENDMSPSYDKETLALFGLRKLESMKGHRIEKAEISDWERWVKAVNRHVKKSDGLWSYRHEHKGWVRIKVDKSTPISCINTLIAQSFGLPAKMNKAIENKTNDTNKLFGFSVDAKKIKEETEAQA